MKHQITITFASHHDFSEALKQITKARAYAYRGNQLGAFGCSMLIATLERATEIKTTTPKNETAKKSS